MGACCHLALASFICLEACLYHPDPLTRATTRQGFCGSVLSRLHKRAQVLRREEPPPVHVAYLMLPYKPEFAFWEARWVLVALAAVPCEVK